MPQEELVVQGIHKIRTRARTAAGSPRGCSAGASTLVISLSPSSDRAATPAAGGAGCWAAASRARPGDPSSNPSRAVDQPGRATPPPVAPLSRPIEYRDQIVARARPRPRSRAWPHAQEVCQR